MNRFLRWYMGLAFSVAVGAAQAALGGDSAEGQRLHAASCTSCHDAAIYTRKERTVNSLDSLVRQMDACAHAAKKDFTGGEKQSIAKFLNDRYYHFKVPAN